MKMMSPDKSIPTPQKESVRSFYEFIIRELPKGLPGKENQFPVTLNNVNFDAVILGVFDKVIEIGLFISGGKYSRLTLLIDKDGNATKDESGVIPDFDLTAQEPDFSKQNIDETAFSVINQIQTYKRNNAH